MRNLDLRSMESRHRFSSVVCVLLVTRFRHCFSSRYFATSRLMSRRLSTLSVYCNQSLPSSLSRFLPLRVTYIKGTPSKQNWKTIFRVPLMVGVTQKSAFMGLTSLVNISQNLDKSGSSGSSASTNTSVWLYGS